MNKSKMAIIILSLALIILVGIVIYNTTKETTTEYIIKTETKPKFDSPFSGRFLEFEERVKQMLYPLSPIIEEKTITIIKKN